MIDGLLIVVVVIGIFMLGSSEIPGLIRATALQALVLAAMPILVHHGPLGFHAIFIGLATVGLKVFLIPRLLFRAMRRAGVAREVQPLIGFAASLVIAGVLVAISLALGERLRLPGRQVSQLLVPAAFSTVLVGLLLLVTRTKALSQVIGYLVLENGIFLFGLGLVEAMPLVVELGILLDVFVAVFIMGIVIHRISQAFDHIDTHEMTTLRD